jgi:rhomboid protease GluP
MEEISSVDAEDVVPFDGFAWPLCAQFSGLGAGWLAPQIPEPILVAALSTYLDLAKDETLLAIVGRRVERAPAESCALTTKRIYWAGAPRRADSEWADPEHPSSSPGAPPPPRCEYLAYKDLPEAIAPNGVISRVVDLGERREIDLGGHFLLTKAVVGYLGEVRALVRGEKTVPNFAPGGRAQARQSWPAVLAAHVQAEKLQAEIRQFTVKTSAASRGVVTYVLAAACVLVYLAMIVAGASPFEPDSQSMFAWGASFGPAVVFDGEVWRIPASLFLHFGLFHLAMNLWCLISTGPAVERFFGHLGFAALYLLSGLGGACASLGVHPMSLCAGASGAVFGILGGLLAYLAIRHKDVPAAILQPMRSGTMAFLGYNVIFGLMNQKIDMAGHLGGLATGFAVGLILASKWATRGDWAGLLRRSAAIAALSLVLGILAHQTIGFARARILSDPKQRAEFESAPAWNDFQKGFTPLLLEFDRINRGIGQVSDQLEQAGDSTHHIGSIVDRLITDSSTLERRFATLPARNDEIRAMLACLASMVKHQAHALDLLKRVLADGDVAILQGPEGLKGLNAALTKDFQQFTTLRDAYFKTHGLSMEETKQP